ncbi:type I restriction-modification system subunit M [Rhodohalobacter sp. 614A]|uniref:type I restriction-modification system subunit M n=1 Tax=Rhodohalobacter sp. 614A TaxID=2908649 RepID=UPI001F1DB2DD|nr:class I SAM-dependent DNA methyltransferase [Rhodohalobacter sp. 614A]
MSSTDVKQLEKRLWEAADNLRANSSLSSYEYSTPVLGLIFLRYAWSRFKPAHEKLSKQATGRRTIGPDDYKAEGVMYLPEEAWYDNLLEMPESEDIGKAINIAMESIEEANPELRDTLPKQYKRFGDQTLKDLLKTFSNIPMDIGGDVFGKIYEYFLGNFAMSEGQKGGEFFTPTSIVKLIVEVLEPYGGLVLDPACGSGGMFIQSEQFRKRHSYAEASERKHATKNNKVLSIYGQEKVDATVRLCKMNLAVHGMEGNILPGNTYYENRHNCVGRFDYVMANPPFNVDGVNKESIEGDKRYPFGIPNPDNANYLWIQEFYSALNEKGRAGFVMANSAADARHSEMEIRKKIIEEGVVDVIISIGSNFFYTVTLPCTLWFFDKGKKGTDRENKVLFIDARNIYRQLDRAHRDFTPEQIDFIARIVRRYRGEALEDTLPMAAEPEVEYSANGNSLTQPENMDELFPNGEYEDIPGLCKVATVEEIEAQGWSLNPGRYVGVAEQKEDEIDFEIRLEELYEELELLNSQSEKLESQISDSISEILSKL